MDVEEQARAVSAFGGKVFRDLLHSGKVNVAMSPLALGMALMATTVGASGETKKELLDMFNISTLDLESCQSLIRGATKSHSVLDIATSLWFDKAYQLNKEFTSICEENFHTVVRSLEDVEDINRWVTSATHGKLRQVIDPLPKPQPLTVVNCVYFHGTWKREFMVNSNLKTKFTGFSGEAKECELMKVTTPLLYTKNDLYEAVEVPYCDRFVATIILPQNIGERELHAVVDRLREFPVWRKFSEQLSSKSVSLTLPQFKVEWQDHHLEEACKDVGLRTCFSPVAAKFSDAATNCDGLYISQIIHRTLIEVGARGMETTVLPEPDSETQVTADRPFIFVVSDTKNGCILFSTVIDKFADFRDDDVAEMAVEPAPVSNSKSEKSPVPRSRSRSRSRSRRSPSRSRSPKRRRSPSPKRKSRSPRRPRSISRSPPPRKRHSRSRSVSRSPPRRKHSRSRSRSPRRGGRGGRYRSRSRSPRSPRYRSPRGRRNRSPSPRGVGPRESKCLFVRNFPASVSKRELADLFGTCGEIKINKEQAPYAFVTYFDRLDAEDAMDKYRGYDLEGKKLCLDWDVGLENKRRKSNNNYVKY